MSDFERERAWHEATVIEQAEALGSREAEVHVSHIQYDRKQKAHEQRMRTRYEILFLVLFAGSVAMLLHPRLNPFPHTPVVHSYQVEAPDSETPGSVVSSAVLFEMAWFLGTAFVFYCWLNHYKKQAKLEAAIEVRIECLERLVAARDASQR